MHGQAVSSVIHMCCCPAFKRSPDVHISTEWGIHMFKKDWIRSLSAIVLAVLLTLVPGAIGAHAADMYPLSITDDLGRKVEITSKPRRFVSLAPSWTEILFELGLGDQVVGVTQFCDYPAEAAKKTKVGGFSDPNIELIVSLQADVVFGTTMHMKVAPEFEKRGIKFVCQNAQTVRGVMDNIMMAAKIAGVPDRADKVNGNIEKTIAQVTKAVAKIPVKERLSVLYLVWDEPVMSVGPNTLISDMITCAGGVSITRDASSDYPSYSLEAIVAKNPDVILAPHVHSGGGLDPATLKSKAGWQTIDAVRKGNVFLVDDNLVSRPGPRVGEGVMEFARALYPELFR